MKKLIMASMISAFVFGCGDDEKKDVVSGDLTLSCSVVVLDTTSCSEYRNASQALSEQLALTCTSEEDSIDMTFAESECPNKEEAPGVCEKTEAGQTIYLYQSGSTITAETAEAACLSGDEPGTYTAK